MAANRWWAFLVAAVLAACAATTDGVAPPARAALLPATKLRVSFVSPGFVYGVRDAASGEIKGLGPDVGNDLARGLGTTAELVTFSSPPAIITAGREGRWDIALMGISAERAAAVDFTAPLIVAQSGYLVGKDVAAQSMAEVDRPGIRIGVFARSSVDAALTPTIRNATLVRVPSIAELYSLLASGKADVLAAAKTGLYAEAAKNPGARVLDGSFLDEPIAIALPKGRDPAALAYVERYVAQAKADGRVQAAIDRANLRGVIVPK